MLLVLSAALSQESNDPFPDPIPTTDRVISVKFAEFALALGLFAQNLLDPLIAFASKGVSVELVQQL